MVYSNTLLFKLTVKLVTVIVGFCLVMEVATLGVVRLVYPQDYTDPLVPYEAIIMGQFEDNDLLCDAQWHDPLTRQSVCRIQPQTGPFDEINIFRCNCNTPGLEIAFWSEQLQVGDLLWRWGWPDTITPDGLHYILVWDEQRIQAYTMPARQFTYHVFVQLVRWHS